MNNDVINKGPIRPLLICNLAPESFSELGKSTHVDQLIGRLQRLAALGFNSIDLGAQSTAPRREKIISGEEEKDRFEDMLSGVWKKAPTLLNQFKIISLDTFRIETFNQVAVNLRQKGYTGQLWFNDVSGRFHDVNEKLVLELSSLIGPFTYICCHNRVQSREETPLHWQAPLPSNNEYGPQFDPVQEQQLFFSQALFHFQTLGPLLGSEITVVFDPCFGFAKGLAENEELLLRVEELMKVLILNLKFQSNPQILWGISRKSFLRARVEAQLENRITEDSFSIPKLNMEDLQRYSEYFHWEEIQKLKSWIQRNNYSGLLWWRLHDENLARLFLSFCR